MVAVRGVGPVQAGQRPGFIYRLLLRSTFSSASFRYCECSFRLQPVCQGAPDLLAFRDTVALFDPFEARGQFRIQQETMQPLCHGWAVYIDLYMLTREQPAKGDVDGRSNHRDFRSSASCLRGGGVGSGASAIRPERAHFFCGQFFFGCAVGVEESVGDLLSF